MVEIQDSNGRLIVALKVRVRHAGSVVCVFIDGRMIAEFGSVSEAARYARRLAQGGMSDVVRASMVPDEC